MSYTGQQEYVLGDASLENLSMKLTKLIDGDTCLEPGDVEIKSLGWHR